MQNKEKYVDNTKPSTLETVDYAIFEWLDKTINVYCNTNEGFRKVPVIWASAERSFQIKNYKDLRDKDGTLITPFISIERKSISKPINQTKSAFQANIKGFDRISYTEIINQDKTSKIANNNAFSRSKKINFAFKQPQRTVYQTKSIRIPTYFDIEYVISIKTSYLQQKNEILQKFIGINRSAKQFLINYDGFQYEAFLGDSFDLQENASKLDVEERHYLSDISVKVIGFVTGEGVNQDDERVITAENAIALRLGEEISYVNERDIAPRRQTNAPQGLQIGETVTALKKTFLIGDGNVVYTINHGLNTRDMFVSVRENFGDFDIVQVSIGFQDLNNIFIDMGNAINEFNQHVVTIIG
jgi:hypothetical protein